MDLQVIQNKIYEMRGYKIMLDFDLAFVMTYPSKRPLTALPLAFTEQGVSMLSSVLRSKIAVEVNISIMRAFVAIRNYFLQQTAISREMEDLWKAINDLSEDNRKEIFIWHWQNLQANKRKLMNWKTNHVIR